MCSSYAKFPLAHLCTLDQSDRDFDGVLAVLELPLELFQ